MLQFSVPHALSPADARTRVDALLSYWKNTYGLQSTWNDNVCSLQGKAMGISFDGEFSISPTGIEGRATDPGMLLRGQATKYLQKKFAEYLNPATPLERLPA